MYVYMYMYTCTCTRSISVPLSYVRYKLAHMVVNMFCSSFVSQNSRIVVVLVIKLRIDWGVRQRDNNRTKQQKAAEGHQNLQN